MQRVPRQWNSVLGGGAVLSTCNVMERGMNVMQYFRNSRTPTDDSAYHADALIRQDRHNKLTDTAQI